MYARTAARYAVYETGLDKFILVGYDDAVWSENSIIYYPRALVGPYSLRSNPIFILHTVDPEGRLETLMRYLPAYSRISKRIWPNRIEFLTTRGSLPRRT